MTRLELKVWIFDFLATRSWRAFDQAKLAKDMAEALWAAVPQTTQGDEAQKERKLVLSQEGA